MFVCLTSKTKCNAYKVSELLLSEIMGFPLQSSSKSTTTANYDDLGKYMFTPLAKIDARIEIQYTKTG